ncbi:MAG: polysaccharide deacetylase family protein [Limisphaerales bacterium]
MPSHPRYYTSLSAFRKLFEGGVPVLTYHKIGSRPPSARIKGLYVSPRLFARQMAELAAAGFVTLPLSDVLRTDANRSRRVVLTFDDGFRNVLRNALAPLAQHRFQAIEFLVPSLLGKTNEWDQRDHEVAEPLMDEAEVRGWLAAGHEIGSHTLTHPFLTRLSLAAAREEIFSSKHKLEDLFGRPIAHFCYPYGDWNEPVRDLVREAGYATACTVEFGVNTADTPPHALRRITARYRSRSLKALFAWLRR